MSIQDLPDELLYQMCQGWDNRTLLNTAESYTRVYQVCSQIIEQRKNIFFEEKKYIESVISDINKRKIIFYGKNFPDDIMVQITLSLPRASKESVKFLSVNQIIHFDLKGNEDVNEAKIKVSNLVPPIMGLSPFKDGGPITDELPKGRKAFIRYLIVTNDYDSIATLIKSILQQGYNYLGIF